MNYHRLPTAVIFPVIFATLIPGSALAADASRGQEIYLRVGCWQCHGYVGQGASTGPKLAPDPLSMAAIRDFIREPGDRMPPYREAVLSDEEIADIHAFLETIPAAPKLEDTILAE